jgi:hypothetical protein
MSASRVLSRAAFAARRAAMAAPTVHACNCQAPWLPIRRPTANVTAIATPPSSSWRLPTVIPPVTSAKAVTTSVAAAGGGQRPAACAAGLANWAAGLLCPRAQYPDPPPPVLLEPDDGLAAGAEPDTVTSCQTPPEALIPLPWF